MRLVIQRVSSASVTVSGKNVGEINNGLFVLFGAGVNDCDEDAEVLAEKLSKLRIMADKNGKMNLSVLDTGASVLVVSQFTLYADTKGGNRPSFIKAKDPDEAEKLYRLFVNILLSKGIYVQTGQFGEYMKINSYLDGPVTIIIDSKDVK